MLLLIIIGVALIAFIIGDFLTSGRTIFGSGTTIATVGGHKIDVQDFQHRMEQTNQQVQQSGQKVDQAVLQQQVLQQMVAETLYKDELEALGLKVTDAELSEMMLGSGSGYIDQMVQQQFGVSSARELHDMAFNPVKYGLDQQTSAQIQQIWLNLENQMEEMMLGQKFQTLFGGSLTANKLDAKSTYDETAHSAVIAYVKKDYVSLPDDEYTPTEAEIESRWAQDKELYNLPEQYREASVIAVEIRPSSADIVKGEQNVEKALAALDSLPETEGVAGMTEFVVNRNKSPRSKIAKAAIQSFVDSATIGRPALVQRVGQEFTIAKLMGRSSEIDSVNIDLFSLTGDRATVDSLLAAFATMDAAQIETNPAVDNMRRDFWVSTIDPLLAMYANVMRTAAQGRYVALDTTSTEGTTVIRVNQRHQPVTVYDIAEITYTVEPSAATVNDLESALRDFLAANPTAQDFEKNAAEAGYNAQPAKVSASSAQVNGIEDSRAAVNWLMNAKKGQVSNVFGDETTGNFIAAALIDVYDDYTPARDPQLHAMIAEQVRSDKKGDALAAQYQDKGKTLEDYAALFETSIDTTTVNFGQAVISRIGINESELTAAAMAAKQGELSAPVKANNAIVVFTVVGSDDSPRAFDMQQDGLVFNRSRGAMPLGNAISSILLGNRKVKNNTLKFFRE